jgi:hypothetical protein
MTERELGRSGLKVSAVGLGCMGMSEFYDPKGMNDEESVRVIYRYLDAGGNFLDTADVYGMGRNESLVGKALRGRRDRVVLATKFANVRGPEGEFLGVRGAPQYVRECCDAILKRLVQRKVSAGRPRPAVEAAGTRPHSLPANQFSDRDRPCNTAAFCTIRGRRSPVPPSRPSWPTSP